MTVEPDTFEQLISKFRNGDINSGGVLCDMLERGDPDCVAESLYQVAFQFLVRTVDEKSLGLVELSLEIISGMPKEDASAWLVRDIVGVITDGKFVTGHLAQMRSIAESYSSFGAGDGEEVARQMALMAGKALSTFNGDDLSKHPYIGELISSAYVGDEFAQYALSEMTCDQFLTEGLRSMLTTEALRAAEAMSSMGSCDLAPIICIHRDIDMSRLSPIDIDEFLTLVPAAGEGTSVINRVSRWADYTDNLVTELQGQNASRIIVAVLFGAITELNHAEAASCALIGCAHPLAPAAVYRLSSITNCIGPEYYPQILDSINPTAASIVMKLLTRIIAKSQRTPDLASIRKAIDDRVISANPGITAELVTAVAVMSQQSGRLQDEDSTVSIAESLLAADCNEEQAALIAQSLWSLSGIISTRKNTFISILERVQRDPRFSGEKAQASLSYALETLDAPNDNSNK